MLIRACPLTWFANIVGDLSNKFLQGRWSADLERSATPEEEHAQQALTRSLSLCLQIRPWHRQCLEHLYTVYGTGNKAGSYLPSPPICVLHQSDEACVFHSNGGMHCSRYFQASIDCSQGIYGCLY